MFSKILCTAALVAVAAATPHTMVNDQSFVDKINAKPGILWKAGFSSRFHGQTLESARRLYGVTADSWGEVQKLPRHQSTIRDEDIPAEFDSEKNWPECAAIIGDIRDQSMCGCCWAFAGASAASDRMCISTNGTIKVPISSEDVCFCGSFDGCGGGQITTPWNHIYNKGAVSGGQYNNTEPIGQKLPVGTGFCADFTLPHCHHHGPQGNDPYPAEGSAGCPQQSSPKCPSSCDANAAGEHTDFAKDKYTFTGGVQQASGEEDIQKAIMEGGPVETAFTVYTDFANYVSGIYHHVSGGVEGGHAVRIVGWGEENGNKYWKVANSWNPFWGEEGYFRIKRGNSECGIEDGVTFSGADATWSKSTPHHGF